MLPVLLMNYFRSREQKWYRVSTVFYSFRERLELRYLFEDEYNEPERPFLVIQYLRITKFSAKEVNLDIIIDTTWQLSGYNLTHVKNFSGYTKEPAEVLGADQETISHLH